MLRKTAKIALLSISVMIAGCASTYYEALERVGVEKRDILVDRVKDARGEQAEAQETFTSALEEFRSLVAVDGGELERQYDKMRISYENADKQAEKVRARITSVEDVGGRLFKEWEAELAQYESADLRRRSQAQLEATRVDYEQLVSAMNRAASKMDPVLSLYNDQVLFLKHNLNARAISALDLERTQIEQRVEALIEEMNAAIAEADAFIASLG